MPLKNKTLQYLFAFRTWATQVIDRNQTSSNTELDADEQKLILCLFLYVSQVHTGFQWKDPREGD